MPVFYFKCSGCKERVRRVLDAALAEKQTCTCGRKLRRDPKGPSAHLKETLDNGAMTRAVERFSDAEELNRDRVANDPRNKPI